jgi:hypothetical protein
MGMTEHRTMAAKHGNEKRRTRNGNGGRTGMTTGMVAEHGMTDYSYNLNK